MFVIYVGTNCYSSDIYNSVVRHKMQLVGIYVLKFEQMLLGYPDLSHEWIKERI